MKSQLYNCISKQITIPQETLDTITQRFSRSSLRAGETFVEAGRVCYKMAFIESGFLRLYNFAGEKEVTLWIGSRNSFITSLSSFIFETPSSWHIEAVTNSELLVINRSDHFDLLAAYPEWLEFDNRVLANAFSTLEERIFSYLYMNAKERYGHLMQKHPSLFNHVPLRHIASMLGITPETLSRLRSR